MNFRVLIILGFLGMAGFAQAQERQGDTTSYKLIIPEEKQELLTNIDMIANMQLGLRNDFQDGEYLGSKFKFEQFRLEIKGYVTEKVYFRFRHRYTSTFEPQSIDKIIKGVDFAYLRFDLSDKWQFTFGKTFADWGGFEFDLNPIDIYEYSDIIEMADNFLFAAGVYNQTFKNHGFSFQLINSRTAEFTDIYGNNPNITPSKTTLGTVFNWRGSFFDGKLTTLWSYSLFNEAKDRFKNYFAFGNQLKLDKLTLYYDFKYSIEGLDRTRVISNDVAHLINGYAVDNTLYYSHWGKVDYRFKPKWQISFVGFIDQAKWQDNPPELTIPKNTDDWRTAYGFIPTLEFFPYDEINLKFFAGYVGRVYDYSEFAESIPGGNLVDYNTGRAIFGVISPLHIF